jgi:exosome complex component RRP40
VPVVTKPGILCKRKPNVYYIDSYQKRYLPAKNDTVIGIIQSKTNEFFWVDINYSEPASKHFYF